MRIYSKNNPAKFHPDLVRNNRPLGFFEENCPNKNNKMSRNSWSKNELTERLKSHHNSYINPDKMHKELSDHTCPTNIIGNGIT